MVQALYAEPEHYLAAVEERLEIPVSGTVDEIAHTASVLKPVLEAHAQFMLPDDWNTF